MAEQDVDALAEEHADKEKYPECAKWAWALEHGYPELNEFFDWLEDKDIQLGDAIADAMPDTESREQLLARFFDIDLKKLEEERRAILEEQRKLNEETDKTKAYREAARKRYGSDDIAVDGNAGVSYGSDPGAFVAAWLWVPEEDIKK